jgi:hypothetical protein
MRLALKLSIDPRNLIRQPLFGVFLTDWAKPKINGHAAVVFVDDASTVTIDPDTRRTSACHDVPPRRKAEFVGTVMYERKSMGARQRTHATAEFTPHQRTDCEAVGRWIRLRIAFVDASHHTVRGRALETWREATPVSRSDHGDQYPPTGAGKWDTSWSPVRSASRRRR